MHQTSKNESNYLNQLIFSLFSAQNSLKNVGYYFYYHYILDYDVLVSMVNLIARL